jgi:hypothetical protein
MQSRSEKMEAENKLKPVAAAEGRKASRRQLAANRSNAARSTGPRTPEGKDAVRWNALKHGLLAKEVVVRAGESPEHPADFHHLLSRLRESFCPASIVEEVLVEKVAACYWRMARVLRAEAGEIRKAQAAAPNDRRNDLLVRELLRAPVEVTEQGEQQWLETERVCRALPDRITMDKILRYETTMERQLYRALHHLERIQRRRQGEAVPPPLSIEFAGVQ